MTDIPEDVMKASMAAVTEAGPTAPAYRVAQIAILAERERAAKVAETFARAYSTRRETEAAGSDDRLQSASMAVAALHVANAIRKPVAA